jgi:hypothetical protein
LLPDSDFSPAITKPFDIVAPNTNHPARRQKGKHRPRAGYKRIEFIVEFPFHLVERELLPKLFSASQPDNRHLNRSCGASSSFAGCR